MNCELCGAEGELLRAIVEGTELNVCKRCGGYGKVIGRVRLPQKPAAAEQKKPDKEILEVIAADYADKIKTAREKRGMKQEEFAKALSEKESLIHSIETGKYRPGIDLARKLEKFLKITLVEQQEETEGTAPKKKEGEFTIGDFVKVRKR